VRARITVFPRKEILDPQGKAIRNALERSGFPEVREVRAGKSFDIDLGTEDTVAAGERLAEMCEKLLANTVVEEYEIEVLAGEPT
jgi:phosphoribosylformylglycinamidine synthase